MNGQRFHAVSMSLPTLRRLNTALLLALLAPIVATAQVTILDSQQNPLTLPRLEGTITLDGWVEEEAWKAIPPLPLTMYEPIYEGEMTEYSELRLAYDDDYLYVSGLLHDNEPDKIRANSQYRDGYSGDDTVGLIIDTFNDNESALWFSTTPNGVRLDMAVSNDLEGGGGDPFGRVINISWNTFWDAATQKNEEGWHCEMRIPFSSLGFQDDAGQVVMGLTAYRYIARKNERHIFPSIPPNWNMGFAKPSQAQKVMFEEVYSKRPVYITPYALGGLNQQALLNDTETAYRQDNDYIGEVGGDIKYNVTSNLTMDLTVNTDFAQVEADDQQVNLTRLSLFFPEKRRFFQERSSIFEFRTQGPFDRLFNSREIGLNKGQTVPIIGGLRLVGRVGGWDVGVINMHTAGVEDLASENFGIFRLRRQVFNPNSFIGGMLTSRVDVDGRYNFAYGFDSNIRVGAQKYLQVKWAHTIDEDLDKSPTAAGLGRIWFEQRGQVGFGYAAAVTWSGPDFNPGIGFVSRSDFIEPFLRLAYGWFPDADSRIRLIRPSIFSFVYFRNTDGSVETANFWHSWDIQMKSGDEYEVEFTAKVEDLLEPLSFPEDTSVPAGTYDFYALSGEYRMNEGSLFRSDASVSVGSFFDGWNIEAEVEPTWNITRSVELGAAYQFNRVRFPDRDEDFYVHLARLRTQISYNTRASVQGFVQYNTASDALSANVRFRYNFREGNDLWIVYNEGWNTDRYGGLAELPITDNRTILLKYTYTFIR